jgi:hypothetical protein
VIALVVFGLSKKMLVKDIPLFAARFACLLVKTSVALRKNRIPIAAELVFEYPDVAAINNILLDVA